MIYIPINYPKDYNLYGDEEIESNYFYFGDKLKIKALFFKVKLTENLLRTMGLGGDSFYTLARFEKRTMFTLIKHAEGKQFEQKNDLKHTVDKRILLNDDLTDDHIEYQIDKITFNSLLKTFDVFHMLVDTSKCFSCKTIGGYKQAVDIYPFYEGFILNGCYFKELNEKNILWALCDKENKIDISDVIEDEGYVEVGGFYYKLCSSDNNKSLDKACSLMREYLSDWSDKIIDSSGTNFKKSQIYKYMKLNEKYIPINLETFKSVIEDEESKVFVTKISDDEFEIETQPINNGSSSYKLESRNGTGVVVEGFTESYIESVINAYKKEYGDIYV